MLLTVTFGRLYFGVTKEHALETASTKDSGANSEKRVSLNKHFGSHGNMRE